MHNLRLFVTVITDMDLIELGHLDIELIKITVSADQAASYLDHS